MLKIFNTFTCKKEIFTPIKNNKIALYVCGVTVYNFCHIGHGRTFVVFDMIVRYLRYSHFKVKYIRNITDIDDKIIQKSLKEKIDINIFTENMIQEMHQDFSSLGLLKPDAEPRVTECINEIISIITELIDKKHAYINNNGDVVFSIESDANYGTLSHQSLESLKSGSRIPINNMKKNPLDFILWKKDHNNEYFWNSPWGKGRPGWHVECSAMTKLYFNNCLDMHGGGSDLLFPHHENERAQSSSLNQKLKVNVWMHSGMVIIKNQKMSKSLGNEYFLKDILLYYDAETVRYFFLSTHYRHPIYYSIKHVKKAQMSLERLYIALYNTNPISNISVGNEYDRDFKNAMNDDFNTPKAFSIFFKLAREINSLKNINKLQTNLLAFRLRSLAGSLGFLLQKPESFLQKKYFLQADQINKIEILVKKRNIARNNQLWEEADNIRKKLLSWGIILEDLPEKTIWRKK